ncbi:MAG: glycosyltransferase family 2 protein, partial [Steroidobacteraceae bacterium]
MDLGIVVPCYNEQAVLPETAARLLSLLEMLTQKGKISGASKLWFVDDGSEDETWRMLESMARQDSRVRAIKLSRNNGQQNALLAGLLTAQGDALVSIDADLQDDLAVLEEMLDKFGAGSEIVYGVRKSRDKDSFAKRFTAIAFYRLMHLLGARSIFNHADYRLMSRRAIESLREFREVNLYLRGIVPLI